MPGSFISQLFIKVGGSDIATELMNVLHEAVIDTSLQLPSMFSLSFLDPALKWVDESMFDLGKEVEISAKTPDGQQGVLIKGEITALEPNFLSDGKTMLVVRGYDKAHRLHRGKKTRTFLKTKDSDLVSKIAGEAGLSAQADTTSITYDYVLQNNQTNMEFLIARAERIGYQVYSAEGKLYFKKGDASLGTGPELKFGESLATFQPTYTGTHQSDKMKVLGWDSKKKQAITSQVTPNSSLNQGGLGKTGGAAAQSAFGTAEAIVTDQPIFTTDEAKALAEGLSNDISREFVQAEGTCPGDPRVKAGYKIKISNVGTRFSGDYFVTSATHIYTETGYETRFSISGRQPNTLSHLLESGQGQGRGLVQGVVVGMVTNLKDPDDLGRVKVKYPWLGDNIESDWVRISTPMAGAARGFMYLPEVNDEVLIAFEHGDVHRPHIVGALWSSTDTPPKKNSEAVGGDGKVNQRIIKTRAGHVVLLDDKEGEEKVSITSKSGHTVILDDKSGKESISVIDKTGSNKMVIDSTKKSIAFNADGDFTVVAKGKVSITSTQEMSLESQAKASVKGTAGLSLDGTSQAELKAATVTVNGSGMTEVKGGIVKIN
ncbi:Actin cross-linking toxin VgrG1 [Thermoflexales bacterium]|nr:Actin cross-linking toxin VgrG1 [Thermoflexales bacterium]